MTEQTGAAEVVRLAQIERTAHRVHPSGVGVWRSAEGKLLSPADAVVIAPADLRWLIEGMRTLAAREAAARAEAWDEAVQALGWALNNGPSEHALPYVAEHNPYRIARTDGAGS